LIKLPDKQITILLLPSRVYNESILELTRLISEKEKTLLYFTLSKPVSTLMSFMDQAGISIKDILFVDAITKQVLKTPPDLKNVVFLSSPSALTEISVTLSKILEKDGGKFKTTIFDSFSTVLAYKSAEDVIKFLHFISAKFRVLGRKAVFVFLEEESNESLLRQLNLFADEIVRVKENE